MKFTAVNEGLPYQPSNVLFQRIINWINSKKKYRMKNLHKYINSFVLLGYTMIYIRGKLGVH